jgi:hypothetical protein
MNNVAVIGAGATFAGTVLLGFVLGVLVAGRSGQQLWVFGGLLAGLALGGYAAFRLLVRSI